MSSHRAEAVGKRLLAIFALLGGLLAGFSNVEAQPLQQSQPRRPNILLIIADDLGYDELACQGDTEIPTPHLDRLAASGTRFTQAYVVSSYCSGSRAGLFTGRYPTRFGYEFNPIGADNEDPQAGLPVTETLISSRLHDAGYVTGLFGKWHLGGTARHHPLRRGFDRFYGFLHEGHYYLPTPWANVTSFLRRRRLPVGDQGVWRDANVIWSTHMGRDEPPYDANNPILREGQPVEEREYLTDAITREAVTFIESNVESPFFACVAYNAVHSPMQALDEDLRKFESIESVQRRVFAGMLTRMDQGVGKLLETLEKHQLRERTLIVFLSDNGGPTRELTSSNAPLRGEKGSLYEGGVRVPFLMSWPGRIPTSVDETPIWSLDLFPTFLQVAEAEEQEADRDQLDGVGLLRLWEEATGKQAFQSREFYWRMQSKAAFRFGPWKIVGRRRQGQVERWELYHLLQDVGEQQDVAALHPEIVRDLDARWRKWDADMQSPAWSRK